MTGLTVDLGQLLSTAASATVVAGGLAAWRARVNARRHRENVERLERIEEGTNLRLDRIEHMLGNGEPGVFLRSDRAEVLIQRADERYASLTHRLDRIERERK